MTLAKKAQSVNLDGFHVDEDDLHHFLNSDRADADMLVEIDFDEPVVLQAEPHMHEHMMEDVPELEVESDPAHKEEFVINLQYVPGADDQSEIEEPEIEVKEDEDEVLEVKDDPWKWAVPNFMEWLKKKLDSIPRHTGKDIVGVERAISYMERLGKECSKAARLDIDNEIDVDALEKARDEIYQGIERLEDRLSKLKSAKHPKKKKKADVEAYGLVKQAGIPNYQIVVSLLMSTLARIVIRDCVTNGKSAEDIFDRLVKKYKLDTREQTELAQLVDDWGITMYTDHFAARDEEGLDPESEENGDWTASKYN